MRFNGDTNRYTSTWVWYLKIGNDPWDIAVVIVNMMGISIPIDSSWFYTPRLECINTLTSCICTSYCWQVHDVYPVVTWNAQDFPLCIFPRWTTKKIPRWLVDSCWFPNGWCFEKWLFPWVGDSTFFYHIFSPEACSPDVVDGWPILHFRKFIAVLQLLWRSSDWEAFWFHEADLMFIRWKKPFH